MAFAALMAALAVVFLYLTAVLPTGGLAFSALAAVCTAVVFTEHGPGWAAAHYAVTALLAMLLVPEKTYVLWYVLALGHYSILKLLIERCRRRWLCWVMKLAVFAVSMAALLWLLTAAFVQYLPMQGPVLAVVLTVVFIVYDIGLTGVLRYYRSRVRHK